MNIYEIIVIFLMLVVVIRISILMIKDGRKTLKRKIAITSYNINYRPKHIELKDYKLPYITAEKLGMRIFISATGKAYKYSILKSNINELNKLLDKIEIEK